jgi:N-acetyl-1-D-myo-inositol-2-amino-2-deoxy-alpha-D-glucopyranoside deacetylase
MVTLPNGLAAVPDDVDPAAFAVADLDAAAGLLAAIVREVRPHVVITYDPTGGYGHPDHVMAHRVTMRALDLAADDWDVPKVYAPAWPLSLMQAAFASMPDVPFDLDGDLPGMVVPDDRVAAVVAAEDHWDAKAAALAAHRTQMHVDLEARTTTQDDGMPVPILGTEWYTLIKGERAGALDADGRETDLFAGTA